MSIHVCVPCGVDSLDHDAQCMEPECLDGRITHMPPLCCPDCGCQSYARAHLDLVWRRDCQLRGGPGNILNDRWEIRRYGRQRRWHVYDLTTANPISGWFRSMRQARWHAEDVAVAEKQAQILSLLGWDNREEA